MLTNFIVGTIEIATDFIFLGAKVTADGDWSHEIKDACFF